MLAFGGGHIPGAINIGGLPELSVWAGWLVDPDLSVLLVLENDQDVEKIVRLFLRTGFTRFAGYLVGGMKAWDNAGLALAETDQLTVHELKQSQDQFQIVDVRSPDEWKKGHIPGAKHIFLPELDDRAGELTKSKPVAVYCDSGYRASLGTSLLEQDGYQVHNVPGSWQAWQKAGYPVAT